MIAEVNSLLSSPFSCCEFVIVQHRNVLITVLRELVAYFEYPVPSVNENDV